MRDRLAARGRWSGHAAGGGRDPRQRQRRLPDPGVARRVGRAAAGSDPIPGGTRCPQLAHGPSRWRLRQPPQPGARQGRRISLTGTVPRPAPTGRRPDPASGGTMPQFLRPVRPHRPPAGSLRQTVSRVGAIGRLPHLPPFRFCPVVLKPQSPRTPSVFLATVSRRLPTRDVATGRVARPARFRGRSLRAAWGTSGSRSISPLLSHSLGSPEFVAATRLARIHPN